MLLFNTVIFLLVSHQLCSLRRRSMSNAADRSTRSRSYARHSAVTVLMPGVGLGHRAVTRVTQHHGSIGLAWGLAIFMIGEASLVFGYLFAIFNSLQGFAIFVFHCLLNEEVRIGWKKMLCPTCLTLDELAKGSSGKNELTALMILVDLHLQFKM